MPDLTARSIAVTLCAAEAAALDTLVPPGHDARAVRTAPDELLFLASPAVAEDIVREVTERIGAIDQDAVVLDVSDGWAGWSLTGADAVAAFTIVSALEPRRPAASYRARLRGSRQRCYGEDDGLTILVPAYWSDHLRKRLVADARANEAAT